MTKPEIEKMARELTDKITADGLFAYDYEDIRVDQDGFNFIMTTLTEVHDGALEKAAAKCDECGWSYRNGIGTESKASHCVRALKISAGRAK